MAPLIQSASDAQRQIIAVPMNRTEDNRYSVDYDAFERAISEHDVKLFIHCNPHNPVGHVWTEQEMDRLFRICQRHHVLIISDEIHQDLITGPNGLYASALTVNNGAYTDSIISMSSLSKSFNMASLHHAEVIILTNNYEANSTPIKLMCIIQTRTLLPKWPSQQPIHIQRRKHGSQMY